MKILCSVLFIFVAALSCTHENLSSDKQLTVAIVDNSNAFKLMVDQAALLENHNKVIATTTEIRDNFKEVSIVKINSNYLMVYRGDKYKSTTKLSTKIGDNNTILLMMPQTTVTCTTSDCASERSGCIPDGYSCTPCSNKGKCTKTVTDNSAATTQIK